MKNGIKNKITRLVLVIALSALILLFIFTTAVILVIRGRSVETSKMLGENAASDSGSALIQQSQQALMFAAKSLAVQSDEKMTNFSINSKQVAEYITNIFGNKSDFIPKEFEAVDQAGINLEYFNSFGTEVTDQAKLAGNAGFLMKNIVANNKSITAVYFAGADKTFIAAEKFAPKPPGFSSDRTNASWYKMAVDKGETTFSDVFDDTAGRGKGISCASPVYITNATGEKELVGVVGIGGLLTDVSTVIDNTKIDYNGFAFVMNAKNEVILGDATKNLANLAAQTPKPEEELAMLLGTYEGREVFLAYHIMPTLGWTMCAVYEYDAVVADSVALRDKINELSDKSQKRIDQTIIATIIVFIIIVLLTGITISAVGKSFSTKLTAPILALSRGIDEIDGKNILFKNTVRTGDEIESLGDSFQRMTVQISSYIDNIATVTAEKERIGTELSIATQIQASMLPCIFPPFPDRKEVDIFAAMHPAKEVGGDFYDFFLVDNDHLAVVIADVSGKGVPAALFMVIAKTLIKNYAQMGKSTAEIFNEANAQLCEGNEPGMFVTAWIGILEIPTGKFTFSNAGHNPPLIKRKDGAYEYLRSKAGFVLAGMEGVKYGQFETTLAVGDELFLYTDGVTEATNANNELLGDDLLLDCMNRSKNASAKEIIGNVEIEIEKFVAGEQQFDDITMLCLQIKDIMNYIEIDAVMDNLDELQEFAENQLESEIVSMKCRFQVAIIVEEIFVNIVKHAYKECGGKMTMGCSLNGDTIMLKFVDDGEMFDPLTIVADTTSSVEDRKIGGLGIHMVKKSVDKIEYAYVNNQNVLTLTKVCK